MKTQSKFLLLLILILNGLVSPSFAAYETDTFKLDTTTVNRNLKERFKDVRHVKEWGAKCDGKELTDVTTTSGSAVVSSASYTFTSADVGKKVYLYGSVDEGTNSGKKLTASEVTISSVASGNATLSATATASVSGVARLLMYTTNDTSAINNAITALAPVAKGDVGARLKFPSGICMASQITLKRQVILQGEGRNNTRIVQIGGTNSNFVLSENFATLTGTGANYGTDPNVPSWFGLEDLQIDGNRVYQSAGNCVSFYGNAQIWKSVEVLNCAGIGMFTEAAATYAYNPMDWRAQEEGHFENIFVRNVGSHGWQMRGPHDSTVTDYTAYRWGNSGTGYGFINESDSVNYSGGAHFGSIHPYTSVGAKTSIYIGAGSDFDFLYSDFGSTTIDAQARINKMTLLGCGIGAVTPCLNITTNADYTSIGQITGGWNFSGLGTGLTMIDVNTGADAITIGNLKGATFASTAASNTLFKTRGNFGNFSGTVSNMTGTSNVCADLGGTYNYVNFTSFGCTTHVAYTAGGHNKINLLSFTGSGTVWSGVLSTTDVVTKMDNNEANYTNVVRGTAAQPGLTFGGNLTTGFYGQASGTNINATIAGTKVGDWGATGLTATAGTVDVGVAGTTKGVLKLNGNTSGTVTVQPAAAAGTWSLTLPTTAGSSNQLLKTDGSGVTTWVDPTTSFGSITFPGSTSGTLTVTAPATITDYTFKFPSSAGTNGYVLKTDGAGTTSWAADATGGGGVDLTAVNAWTGQQYFAQATLTDGANISWNLNTQQASLVTLGGNRTLDNPTNKVAGGTYTLIIKQDATGSRTLSYGTNYKFQGGVLPVLTTAANSVDILTCISDGSLMFCGVQYDMK